MPLDPSAGAEALRLLESFRREKNWERWGPYLSERQWGTVREDYSADGEAWAYLPHEHARSRAYRWGEDGLLGLCDREGRLCFAAALWNGHDPILKERLFGLNGPEGNHGEDVKECYFYLDGVPTSSYLRAMYRYPQAAFPYARLVEENHRRGSRDLEYELVDTGIFDGNRFCDVTVEYAKAAPDDVLIRFTVTNRGPDETVLHLLPTLWFRNTWAWGRSGEGYWPRPSLTHQTDGTVRVEHPSLGRYILAAESGPAGAPAGPPAGAPAGASGGTPARSTDPDWLYTENETNAARLFGTPNPLPYVKDAFHEVVVHGRREAVNPARSGTKAAAWYRLQLPPGGAATIRLRLAAGTDPPPGLFGPAFDRIMDIRRDEADAFYAERIPAALPAEDRNVIRQAYAGLVWSRQFYYYVVKDWLEGDPLQPRPPRQHGQGRNRDWPFLFNRDVISMPDTWEYPWYAAWDLAFHTIPFARIDPEFAKKQLVLLLREWYMHPSGQLPAYEYDFSDQNPPVHAWACWRTYKMTGPRGGRDRAFLERTFHKLLLNFTWWVNRKDLGGNNLFSGGFLGLDNIGVFDRSRPLPAGGHLEQADGTAWMAFFSVTMLSMALELALENPAYEDIASKFFEHFTAIADAMNRLGGTGLWDEEDGFYYDRLRVGDRQIPMRVRSIVGLIPLVAVDVLHGDEINRLPGFSKRLRWFLENRPDLARDISYLKAAAAPGDTHRLLAIPSRERLERVLLRMLDESEFLSPYGIRSLSRFHLEQPFRWSMDGQEGEVGYWPGESESGMFGGNSNWRGPVWLPINYLLIEALERYHHFYGDGLQVECPTGSGVRMNLRQVAREISRRLATLFLPDAQGNRPCHGGDPHFARDPLWKDLLLFHEYFHGETGRGCGASHQTGWTALVIRCLEDRTGRGT